MAHLDVSGFQLISIDAEERGNGEQANAFVAVAIWAVCD